MNSIQMPTDSRKNVCICLLSFEALEDFHCPII